MSSGLEDQAGVPLDRIVAYLDNILQTESTPDYPTALNGLQLANRCVIKSSCCSRFRRRQPGLLLRKKRIY